MPLTRASRRHDPPEQAFGKAPVGLPKLRFPGGEGGLGLGAAHPVRLDVVHAGHALAILIVLADHHQHVAGVGRGGVLGVGKAGDHQALEARILEGDVVGHLRAEAVAHHAHPTGVDKGQGPQVLQGGLAAIGGVEIRIVHVARDARVAATDGIDAEHDKAPPRHLDAIGIARLAVVLVAVNIDGPRQAVPHRRRGRPQQLGPDGDAVVVVIAHIGDLDPAEIALDKPGDGRGNDDNGQADHRDDDGLAATFCVKELRCVHAFFSLWHPLALSRGCSRHSRRAGG